MSQKTLELITEAFDRHKIKYRTVDAENFAFIEAGYNINGGPTVRVAFIAQNSDSNDVQIRINGLMHNISNEKRIPVLEACNRFNREMRFLKFYLDKDNDLTRQGDLPSSISDDCVGEGCFELFLRTMQILDERYHYFPEAVYGSAPEEKSETMLNALSALKDLRDHPITLSQDQQEK